MNNSFQKQFLCPRYWGIWLLFSLLKPFAYLPYTWNKAIGKGLGNLLFILATRRKKIALANIKIAFPDNSEQQNKLLAKQHFQALGFSLFEESMVNRIKDKNPSQVNFSKRIKINGIENLQHDNETGLIIIIPHFTTINVTGYALSLALACRAIYRKHDMALMDYLILKGRTIQSEDGRQANPIANTETRQIVKTLRQGGNILILPDQRYRAKGSIQVPFFGQKVPSNPGVNKLSKLGKAKVVVCFTRQEKGHYSLNISTPLENFPSGDDLQDTQRLHKLYEQEIRQNPSQYLWVHDRWDIKDHL